MLTEESQFTVSSCAEGTYCPAEHFFDYVELLELSMLLLDAPVHVLAMRLHCLQCIKHIGLCLTLALAVDSCL